MLLQYLSCSVRGRFLLLVLCCAWSSGRSFLGRLIWRALSLLFAKPAAFVPGGSYVGSAGAFASMGAGVVVSAFRFTPFLA